MDVCTCEWKNRTKREPRDGAEKLRRASDIMSFVESLAGLLLGTKDGLESVGSLSLERLERPGEGNALFLQGEACLQDPGQSRRFEAEWSQLELCAGVPVHTVQNIEFTKFAGYGMYSISHQNGTVESVLFDPSQNQHDYNVWSSEQSPG